MFTASRHAQQLAGNFLDDVDEFQRASRAADRRAMSHFDDAVDPLTSVRTPAFEIQNYISSPEMRYKSSPAVKAYTAKYYQPSESVSHRTAPPLPPFKHVTTHYGSDLTGVESINSKYVHHGLSSGLTTPTHRAHFHGRSNRHHDNLEHAVCQEVLAERRRINRKMDDLMSYKLPDVSIYNDLRSSIRKVHDTMDKHRTLLDRYSTINMQDNSTVEDHINSKFRELGKHSTR